MVESGARRCDDCRQSPPVLVVWEASVCVVSEHIMRGWQPPFHSFQSVAIAVYCTLVFSFYMFFSQFSGSSALKASIIGLFSPLCLFSTLLAHGLIRSIHEYINH